MWVFQRRRARRPESITKVHVGAGGVHLDGWWNVDLRHAPGVDEVMDVREGMPFRDLSLIYAEHFIEHLTLEEALLFLAECRRVLAPSGVLRLSTPNLDWVMLTHYHFADRIALNDALRDCLMTNKAFHGWGHRFLYNKEMLGHCLAHAGFSTISFHRYGESTRPELQNIERHETYLDGPALPHLVIAEATGRQAKTGLIEPFFSEYTAALKA